MPIKLVAPVSAERFQLTITQIPAEDLVSEVCELIYDSRDKNLIRSLSDLPYIVGRSFPQDEVDRIHRTLKELKVGHQFKNQNNPSQIIGFENPVASNKPKVADAPSPKTVLRPLRSKLKWIALAGGILAVTAMAQFFKFSSNSSSEKAKTQTENFQAVLENFSRDVEFRKRRELAWQKVYKDLGLVEDDGLRTYENSSAILKYREGSRVFIRPNTLVVIGKEATTEDRRLRLEDGTLQARLKPSATPSTLAIETKVGTLEMKAPAVGEAAKEARIETHLGSEGLKIKVTEGQAVLKPAKPDAAPVQIQSRQEVSATSETILPVVSFHPSIELYSPADQEHLSINPEKESRILFRWEDIADGTLYRLDIAADAEMKNILLSQNITRPEIELHYLDPGLVFWRVVTLFDGISYESSIRKLYVQEHHN